MYGVWGAQITVAPSTFFFFFFIESIADTHIYRYMINEFIYKYIKMSKSGSYMRSLEALYQKLNLLDEICFDLITFCQEERTCVMYLSEFLYLSYGVFGSSSKQSDLELMYQKLCFTRYPNFIKILISCLIGEGLLSCQKIRDYDVRKLRITPRKVV